MDNLKRRHNHHLPAIVTVPNDGSYQQISLDDDDSSPINCKLSKSQQNDTPSVRKENVMEH